MRVEGKSLEGTDPEILADDPRSNDWFRHAAGEGAKGPRPYDWARVRLLWSREPKREHWLLVRRSLKDINEWAYYICFAPTGTTPAELAGVAGYVGRSRLASKWPRTNSVSIIAKRAPGTRRIVT
jgi:hypothetical protein